ncbi:hypothetical protein K1T71_005028 [Dendrolimus kikuchii]|uniref:Uncharacterized protein n=1 Tax=Dendrolimus kikuchii TaxID=765133 RepID=A0ACC1D675_9NEOP|nr:hypothetical protein K1T71_005028 [Dendrolimus kikuchii]
MKSRFETGYNISEISRRLNESRGNVRFWIRRHGEEGELLDHCHNNSGCCPILNAAQKAHMRGGNMKTTALSSFRLSVTLAWTPKTPQEWFTTR